MAKQSRAARARRAQQNEAVARIEAAWQQSVPADKAKEFAAAVEAARARGPLPPPPDMAPGTAPNPPRPGREPKMKADENRNRRPRR